MCPVITIHSLIDLMEGSEFHVFSCSSILNTTKSPQSLTPLNPLETPKRKVLSGKKAPTLIAPVKKGHDGREVVTRSLQQCPLDQLGSRRFHSLFRFLRALPAVMEESVRLKP